MQSLDAFARTKLAALDAGSLRRKLVATRRLAGPWVERGGKRYISFSCNDYLGLTHHPAVVAASAQAVEDYGTGAGASRLVTGNHPLIDELEHRLARFKGAEAACVFSSGYMANAGTIPTFAGQGDWLIVDELAHACIWAGAKLSGAHVDVFEHNNVEHLDHLLKQRRDQDGAKLVITEGVFSMDGDVAPLDRISRRVEAHGAWLMTDDAHGVGVLAEGRGTGAMFPTAAIDLAMGTLSKSLASSGGYVCGSQAAIDLLKTRARTLIYSTGIPPASAAAALAALDIIEADPDLTAVPLARARRFTRAANLPDAQSAVVPVLLGDPKTALSAQAALEAEGFLVVAIRPPTVPVGTSRLRIAFTADHLDEDVDRLAAALRTLTA